MDELVNTSSRQTNSANAFHGLRTVLFLVGFILLAMAGMMLFPMMVDWQSSASHWKVFAISAGLTASLGGILMAKNRLSLRAALTIRQAFMLTPLSWLAVASVSAMPFYFSDYGSVGGNLTNAFFESMSGITTTGATVISGLDDAPRGLLLWRAILQWMGGVGIIAMAIAILPALGIGGMQLFRTESSDRSEKAMPRVRQIAMVMALVYIGLTACAAVVYFFAGMTAFDAIAHAMTSIATGGYSTSDLSFAKWEANGIQWFASVFMLAGSVPFVLYVRFVAGEARAFWDRQVKTLLALAGAVSLVVGLCLFASGQFGFEAAMRAATFNVVSVISTTGFASSDYGSWGNVAVGLFFMLAFVGGCTGSTSGGIKVFRFEVMAIMLKAHFMRLLYPNGVFARTYGTRRLDDDVTTSVVAFLSLFFLCYIVLTLALMAFGLNFLTSASAAVSALSNIGPGLGAEIGPAGNFSTIPAGAKWLLSAGMLLGRLEIFSVLILFIPRFWRA